MRALERRRGGQDHVGVARRLVDVDVDADEQVEPGERALHPVRVRRRARGVAGERDQRPDLAVAGRLHLLRERGGRELAERLGEAADAGPAAGELRRAAAARRAGRVALPGGGAGEHRAAGPVEVAGEDVEHVDEPGGERPERLGRRPDPAVDGGGLRRGELARHPPDGVRGDAGDGRDRLGRERLRQLLDRRDPLRQLGEPAGRDQVLREEDVDEREEQMRVGAGTDRMVLVGDLRRAAAARVDDDELPAARPQRLQPPAHVGRGHQRAVRGQRVRAEHQQVHRAVDVGDRDGERRAEHERAGDLLRPLVDRAGREHAVGAERLDARTRP